MFRTMVLVNDEWVETQTFANMASAKSWAREVPHQTVRLIDVNTGDVFTRYPDQAKVKHEN